MRPAQRLKLRSDFEDLGLAGVGNLEGDERSLALRSRAAVAAPRTGLARDRTDGDQQIEERRPGRPYRRSIWRHDERYDIDPSALSASEVATICRLSSVDAAKKQVPPVPPKGLLAIAKAARALPAVGRVSANQIVNFLESTVSIHGAGIPTVVCMLAVESEGAYPPMDRRVVAGLRKLGRISQLDADKLESGEPADLADVYVRKVIPAWIKERKSQSAEDVH